MTADSSVPTPPSMTFPCAGETYVSAGTEGDEREFYFTAECNGGNRGDCGWSVNLDSWEIDGEFACLTDYSFPILHQKHLDHRAARAHDDPQMTAAP
jgi:hypothetical protein